MNTKNYIYELDNFIDCLYVYNKAQKLLSEDWLELSDPYALGQYTDNENYYIQVESDDYLSSIKAKFPKLKSYIKLLKSEKGIWPAHVDNWRITAINIPLSNIEGCDTIFYKDNYVKKDSMYSPFGKVKGTWKSNKWITYIETKEELFKHQLTKPTIINTNKPHSVIKHTEGYRIIASWTYDAPFEQAVKDFSCQ